MIPLLIIILLVIWLIIKIRRQAEYYKVEGLKLSWANKANIEGNVSKWIFVLKDKSGNEIHRYENNEAENLKDWTNVSVDVIGKKEFDEKIIGDNTLEIYYNDAEESKKLYTTTVNYSESDFSGTIDTTNLEEVQEVIAPPPPPQAVAASATQRPNPISLLVAGPDACRDKATDVVWTGTCKVGNLEGVDTFDLSGNNQLLYVNSNKKLPKNYTLIYAWKPRNSDSGWRTLHRGDADHWAIVKDGGKELGMYSNRDGGFRGTGYNITPDKWQFLVVTGQGTSDTSSKGTSTFYVDLYDGKGVQKVGTSDRVACGTKFQQIGWAGQEPGYLVAALVLDGILPKSEMEKVSADAKRHFFDKISSTRGIRYVWFGYENSGWSNRPLNISQIEVYSGGVNIVKGFGDDKVQSSSQYNANWATPKKLFDGNTSTIAHTTDSGTNWWKIDLGKAYSAIDKVMVYNRDNCCWDRWAESFVKLLDKDGNEIARSEKLPSNKSQASNYKEGGHRIKTFTFGNTGGASVSAVNLTGGFKWYAYKGSYLSAPSSFNNKNFSARSTGITSFTNKSVATGGYLPFDGREDNYGVRWQGRFVPKKTGVHKFWTKSDDMSYLYVNNSKVVDNGGEHGMEEKGGTINMTKDKEYLIEIFFGEKGGGDDIIVWFQEPNGKKTTNFKGYMVKDTKICSSEMFSGRNNVDNYKHCLECAHRWEPGQHKRAINCENIWLDD